jgi:hypothetical protein
MTTGRINQVTLVKKKKKKNTNILFLPFFRHHYSTKSCEVDQEVLIGDDGSF